MSLSREEFALACKELQQIAESAGYLNFEVKLFSHQYEGTSLSIDRLVQRSAPDSIVEGEEAETVEIDDERVEQSDRVSTLRRNDDTDGKDWELEPVKMRYLVHYSVSYQVPVLYIRHIARHASPLSIEEIQQLLVPESSRAQLTQSSPLGMLTLADTPGGGPPALMLHPCHTQEVMQRLVGSDTHNPLRYLILWLGFVGPVFSLAIPPPLMQRLNIELDKQI